MDKKEKKTGVTILLLMVIAMGILAATEGLSLIHISYVIVLILLKKAGSRKPAIAAADRRAKWEISTDHMSCIF